MKSQQVIDNKASEDNLDKRIDEELKKLKSMKRKQRSGVKEEEKDKSIERMPSKRRKIDFKMQEQ